MIRTRREAVIEARGYVEMGACVEISFSPTSEILRADSSIEIWSSLAFLKVGGGERKIGDARWRSFTRDYYCAERCRVRRHRG